MCVSEVFVWSTVVFVAIVVVAVEVVLVIFFAVGLVAAHIADVLDWVLAVVIVAVFQFLLGRHDHTLQITGKRCHLRAVRLHGIEPATAFER